LDRDPLTTRLQTIHNLGDLRRHEDRQALAAERARILRRLHFDGMTWTELGDLLGVTRQRAHTMAKEAPCPTDLPKMLPDFPISRETK